MMVVITLSSCPQKLRGDLTRWLFEIDTGVYVGNLSARVRDALWDRICNNIGSGRASMAYSSSGEQKLDFRIYDERWEPVDYDGIKLVRRNTENPSDNDHKKSSKAVTQHINRLSQQKRSSDEGINYTVIDIETSGISEDDCIIEIAALKIRNKAIADRMSFLLKSSKPLSKDISDLTGITDEMLEANGVSPEKAIVSFTEFIEDDILIGHNVRFDMRYIQKLCKQAGIPIIKNRTEDTMRLARKKVIIDGGYSLSTVCKHFGIAAEIVHRAAEDCDLTYRIYTKLNEN